MPVLNAFQWGMLRIKNPHQKVIFDMIISLEILENHFLLRYFDFKYAQLKYIENPLGHPQKFSNFGDPSLSSAVNEKKHRPDRLKQLER